MGTAACLVPTGYMRARNYGHTTSWAVYPAHDVMPTSTFNVSRSYNGVWSRCSARERDGLFASKARFVRRYHPVLTPAVTPSCRLLCREVSVRIVKMVCSYRGPRHAFDIGARTSPSHPSASFPSMNGSAPIILFPGPNILRKAHLQYSLPDGEAPPVAEDSNAR